MQEIVNTEIKPVALGPFGDGMPDWEERFAALPDVIKQQIYNHARCGHPDDRPGVGPSYAVVVYETLMKQND